MISPIAVVLFPVYIHQALFLTYFLQLKEYRFDRFYSQFRSEPFKFFSHMFDLRIWYRSRPTLRSLLTFLVLLSLYFIFNYHSLYLSLILLFPTNILFSFLFLVPKTILITQAKTKLPQTKGVKIGITGSFGKSFTKDMIAWVLSRHFKTVKTKANNNTIIGIAQNILSWPSNFDYAVIEMAAYKRGEIAQICRLVNPDIGIITGLGDQHLDLFGSLANIKKAKFELIDSLSSQSFRLVKDQDFSLKDIANLKTNPDSVSFTYQSTPFSVPVLGSAVITNVIATIKLCHHLGISLQDISHDLSKFPKNTTYPKLIKNKQFICIDDTHNSSFESFKNLINYANIYPNLKILLSNGIIELGKNEIIDYKKLNQSLSVFDQILTTNPLFYQTVKSKNNIKLVKNHTQMLQGLKDFLNQNKNSVVFAKGRLYPSIYQFLNIHV